MICYIDSSAVLRTLFGDKDSFDSWKQIQEGISSYLLVVECHRVIDRYRLEQKISDQELSELKKNLTQFLKVLKLFSLDERVLKRAAGSFPTVIGTLDAVHLSTALFWQEENLTRKLVILTHDQQLITAASAVGIEAV